MNEYNIRSSSECLQSTFIAQELMKKYDVKEKLTFKGNWMHSKLRNFNV